MDVIPFDTLDQLDALHWRLYYRCLHHLAMHLPVCTPHLSSVRGLAVRSQRFLPLIPRRGRHPVLARALLSPGRG